MLISVARKLHHQKEASWSGGRRGKGEGLLEVVPGQGRAANDTNEKKMIPASGARAKRGKTNGKGASGGAERET